MTDIATDLTSRAADIIERHTEGTRRRRERAEGNTDMLRHAGLLVGGTPHRTVSVRDQVIANLQCVFSWRTAETICDELDAAGLLAKEA